MLVWADLAEAPAPPSELERRTLSKVIRRLIPFVFLCYVVAYIDRVNINFVNSILQKHLEMDPQTYGRGAALFFLGYFLFEIPSNLILERVGARIWIARIMIVWGILSMGVAFVVGKWSFYGMRILLGLAEAGFFPGMVLYLTYWIPARERARAGALFMTAAPVAMLVGAPIWTGVQSLDGWMGLHHWQWLFILEGFPAVALGIATLLTLTDRPEQARWLTPEERDWLTGEMARERALRSGGHHGDAWRSLASWKIWLLCLIYFLQASVTYGLFLWLSKILIDASGYKENSPKLMLINMIPFVFALAAMVLIGRHSDRTKERKWHVAACALLSSIGLGFAAFSGNNVTLLVIAFTLCQIGNRSILAPFWAIPPAFLGGTAAAAGIAMINAVGNLGGYFGGDIMGQLRGATQGYSRGLLVLSGASLLQAILVAFIRLPEPKEAAAPPK